MEFMLHIFFMYVQHGEFYFFVSGSVYEPLRDL